MKKKSIANTIATLIMVMTFMLILNSCGTSGAKPSGTFTNPDDSSNYMVFDKDTVTVYENGNQVRNGTYTSSAKTSDKYLLVITYEDSSPSKRYWIDENQTTIYYGIDTKDGVLQGDIAFVKE